MSERNKTHNGRDQSGHYKVRQEDVEELRTDPQGEDFIKDDVRLGGAVADTGPQAGLYGKEIEKRIRENEEDVDLRGR